MKKITLSILALTCAGYCFSQGNMPLKAPDKRFMIDAPYKSKNFIAAQQPAKSQMSYQQGSKSINSISYVNLGSSANILTVLSGECNVVAAYDALSTVVFIHRNDPSLFGFTKSQYRYDVSKDKGQSFNNNVGVLNPTADELVGGINARYPMVAFYNPAGNTVQDSLWSVYFGTWHNGATTDDTWDGSNTGVFKMNGDTSTWTEDYAVQNSGNIGITTALVNGLPGEFWAVDFDDLGAADSILILYKGVWNPGTKDVDWNIVQNLPLPLTYDGAATYNIEPVIAFDPSGMNGWVATSADVMPNVNQVYEPIFCRTTDGGATWSAPIHLDLTQFPSVMATMDASGSGNPTTAFDADLVVDVNGNPHYAVVVGSGVGHSIESGLALNLFDFSYNTATLTWTATIVDSVQTFRGNVAAAATGSYTTDNRPQLSLSPAGDKVFFIWSDSDPLLTGGDNSQPELWGKGLDVTNGRWSPTTDFTLNDLTWDPHLSGSPSYYPSVSTVSLRNSANNATLVPVVVVRPNVSGSGEDPATFYYFNNIQFDDELFLSVPESAAKNNTVRVFPNPASDEITIYFNGIQNTNASVTVTDVLGKTVKALGNTFGGFAHYSVRGLDKGIYFINIKSENEVVTQRFVVAK
jgi:hypothetical protein